MPITRKPIVEASDDQIRTFCEIQQADPAALAKAKSRGALLALLGPIWEHDFIPIQVVDEPAPDEAAAHAGQDERVAIAPRAITGGRGSADPRVRLTVGSTSLPGGKDPVNVGVNGVTASIQRDMEVDLPLRYFYALQNAVGEDVDQDLSTGDKTITKVTRFPLTIHSMPDRAEIAAWRERTDNELMPA